MIVEILKFEEGYRPDPYYCSEMYPTIGIGTKIGPKNGDLSAYQFRVNEEVAKKFLEMELSSVCSSLERHSWYNNLDVDRKGIIKSMAYQMGVGGVLKFKNMIKASENKDWCEMSKQALDSKWSRQTPERANRHSEVLKHGSINSVYGDLL